MKYFLYTFLLVFSSFHGFGQQDLQFSQYVFDGLNLNPAYAGYKEDWYFNATYRKQWSGFPGSPQDGSVSIDGVLPTEQRQYGVGAQIAWDKLGAQTNLTMLANFAYRIQIDKHDTKRLSLGLAFGFDQYGLDGSVLQPNDQNDQQITPSMLTTYKPDARVGLFYNTPNFYTGLSFMDILSVSGNDAIVYSSGTTMTTVKKYPHAYFTMGGIFPVSQNVKLRPSLMFKEDSHAPSSLDLTLFALLSEKLWLGASLRQAVNVFKDSNVQDGLSTNGTANALLEYYFNNRFRIGYSYDFITSGLSTYQSGSHEISLGYLFPNVWERVAMKSPRYF